MIDIKRLVNAFGYAFEGIVFAWQSDQNLRIHFFVAILVILASIFFKVGPFEMGILGVMILLVIVTEMINSAIEKTVDLVTREHRVEAKIAKDVSSGMVLITVIGSVIVGTLIFLPYVLRFLNYA